MKRVKYLQALFLSAVLLFGSMAAPFSAYGAEPAVGAQGAALIDGKTGRLLWGKNAETPMAMASTTKIMTALLVLEHTDGEDIVTVSKNAARQPEVHMDLKEGEKWRVKDLLSAMMLRSYNDAAVALAEHTFGSVEAFCKKMTERAKEMGAKQTIFGSPNGLDSHLSPEQHHSTAYDMARIAARALENTAFRELVRLPALSCTDLSGKHRCDCTNADRFLREFQGAMGVKTGFTNKAGHCFVGAAERQDIRLVSAVLGSGWGSRGKEGKWKDTKALMQYGFGEFAYHTAVEEGRSFGAIPVEGSPVKELDAVLSRGYTALFSEKELAFLRLKAELPESLSAPVADGEVIGRAKLFLGEDCLADLPVCAAGAAFCYTFRERLSLLLKNWLGWRESVDFSLLSAPSRVYCFQ